MTFATVAVNVTDKFSNPVPNVTVKLTAAANTAGSLSGTTSVTSDATGTASFATLSMTKAGTYTLTASATGLTSIVSSSFTISPAAASQLTFATQPKNAAAGTALTVAVEALDSFGNPVPGVSISSLTLSPAATLNNFAATTTATTGLATIGGLSVNTVGTYTMTASGGRAERDLRRRSSSARRRSPPISFVNQPGTTNAGSVIGPVTVAAFDAFGNPVPGVTLGMALTGGSFSSGTTTIMTNAPGQAVFSNLVTNTSAPIRSPCPRRALPSVIFQFLQRDRGRSDAVLCHPAGQRQRRQRRCAPSRSGSTDKYGNVGSRPGRQTDLVVGHLERHDLRHHRRRRPGELQHAVDHARRHRLHADGDGDRLASVRSNAFNILALPVRAWRSSRNRPAPRPAATSAR